MDRFVEMLRASQGGHGMENLARAYGMSMQQAQAAAEAVMPAFAESIRKAMQSPDAMASLMTLMMSGPYAAFYNQAPAAPTRAPPELTQAGTVALDAVFGSSEVSRAVANQLAATTGVGAAVAKEMLPSFAALLMGGLAKSLAASGTMQQMLAAMLSRMTPPSAQAQAPTTTGNPWIDAFMAFTAAVTPPRPAQAPAAAGWPPAGLMLTGNPWADAFAQMMFRRAAPPAPPAQAYASPYAAFYPPAQQPPAPEPVRTPASAWQDVVNAMSTTLAQATGQPPAAPASAPPPQMPYIHPALLPFQEFFTQLFAQGFPPPFPATQVPEFWRSILTPAPSEAKEAKPAPGDKPRLIKGPPDKGG